MYKELDLKTLCAKGGIFELTLDNGNDIFAIYYRESIFITVALCIVCTLLHKCYIEVEKLHQNIVLKIELSMEGIFDLELN